MTAHTPISGAAIGLPVGMKLRPYLSEVQTEACHLEGILEAAMLLFEEGERGRNAVYTLITIALERSGKISLALDSVNLPEGDAQ
jgi:hypothetical protein